MLVENGGWQELQKCTQEDFLNAKDILSMIPESLECLSCPSDRFGEERILKHRQRFQMYLARRKFVFDNVAKLADFFGITENTAADVLIETKGMRRSSRQRIQLLCQEYLNQTDRFF